MTCTACGATTSDSAAFCPACGAALKDAGEAATVYTPPSASSRSTAAPTRLSSPTTTPGPRSGGGRFGPGVVLAGRYQILGLLGRGGMGEVYRADDLSLGQSVALKFLPDFVAADADRLARFRTEVSVARQVSHPNVCRVYDIGEADGHVFLSMEYVDGEDLAVAAAAHRPAVAGQGGRDGPTAVRGAGRGARQGRAPPRPQAGQRHDRRPRPRAAGRLRAGWRRRGRDVGPGRHAGLHGAGAVCRASRVGQVRHLRARPGALRDVHRQGRLQRRRR